MSKLWMSVALLMAAMLSTFGDGESFSWVGDVIVPAGTTQICNDHSELTSLTIADGQ